MRVRLLLTNGDRTVDLFWLEHDGEDVYYGIIGDPGHFSYHRTGKRHYKSPDGYNHFQDHMPLTALQGAFHLITVGFMPSVVLTPGLREYKGKPADAVVFLDTRAMPTDRVVNVLIGLLEPGRLDTLPVAPALGLNAQQLQVVPSVTPWVYVMVTWTA